MGLFNGEEKFNKESEIEKGKREADREIEIYKREKMLGIDRTVDEYRRTEYKKVETVSAQCNEQIKQYEHDFHSRKEKDGVELALLTAKLENKKDLVESIDELVTLRADVAKYKALAEAKDLVITGKTDTIKLLDDTVKVVVGKLSKVDVGSLALNVSTNEAKK